MKVGAPHVVSAHKQAWTMPGGRHKARAHVRLVFSVCAGQICAGLNSSTVKKNGRRGNRGKGCAAAVVASWLVQMVIHWFKANGELLHNINVIKKTIQKAFWLQTGKLFDMVGELS